jgi:hypothetical protein
MNDCSEKFKVAPASVGEAHRQESLCYQFFTWFTGEPPAYG